jgi:signal transduction histidine kinase
MNPISAFFVRNIVAVFFLYGLAFFALGLALALAGRRTSQFRFAQAILPLAAFGFLHGAHEWIEMFQKSATLSSGYIPTIPHELLRLVVLVASFSALSAFGIALLGPGKIVWRRVLLFVAGMIGVWLLSVLIVTVALGPSSEEAIALADVLARYSLGIPGALVGAWALMAQQRTFREHGMPRFGRDLVWCATALILYGVVGQIFVRQTPLVPSNVLNSAEFLQWFGIPVQLFRGVMAAVLTVFMVRALNAFELERQRQLESANQARLEAQAAALEAERRVSREMERLNEELRLTAQELSLLLSLSNLLATPMSLSDRLRSVLEEIVRRLNFPDAGLILLIGRRTDTLDVRAVTGCGEDGPQFEWAQALGQQCVAKAVAVCRHADGTSIEFMLEEALDRQKCRRYFSPVTMISLPLSARRQVIGSIVLCRKQATEETNPSSDEFGLIAGIAQQLGLSIENARLYQEAQEREQLLGDLLHRVVGAQEAERQRIARELHDATGQSLTAIALGLRGVENVIEKDSVIAVGQINELRSFTTDALGELRHLIADLRPSQLDDLGLVAALQWYVQEFNRRYPTQTDFVVDGNPVRLSNEYETVLFRITQEALTNVAKHSGASRASVRLVIQPTQLCLTVRDDGLGFDLDAVLRGDSSNTGWGLLGIQERAALIGGQYEIESKPGHGTLVRVQVPLMAETDDVKDTATIG